MEFTALTPHGGRSFLDQFVQAGGRTIIYYYRGSELGGAAGELWSDDSPQLSPGGVQWRETKSVEVSTIRMASQRSADTMTTRTRCVLHFQCMKKRITSEALQHAITRATTVFHGPRLTYAIPVVRAVKASSVAKMTK